MSGITPYFYNSVIPLDKKKITNPHFSHKKLYEKISKYLKPLGKSLNLTEVNSVYKDAGGLDALSILTQKFTPMNAHTTGVQASNSDIYSTGIGICASASAGSSAGSSLGASKIIPMSRDPLSGSTGQTGGGTGYPEGARSVTDPPAHGNMVPFFGGSVKQNTTPERRDDLDTFTGQFRLDQLHKHENPVLFTPAKELTTQMTSPRQSDRYVTSLNIRNSELPFEQERVGRGLNDGYTALPSGGFHNPVRITPKSDDELYVNPKQTYNGRVIKGKHMTGKRTAQPNAYNYSQKVLVDNENGQRNFVTTGIEISPMVRSKVVLHEVRKSNKAPQIGPATNQIRGTNTASSSSATRTGKQTFLGTLLGAFQSIGSQKRQNGPAKTTLRQLTKTGERYGGAPTSVSRQQVVPTDQTKTTNRQTYENQSGNSGPVQSQVQSKKLAITDQTKTTGRQTIEHSQYTGSVNTGGIGLGQKTYDPNDLTKTTMRQTIEVDQFGGNINTNNVGLGQKTYDPNDLTKTTMRQTIENAQYGGNINTNNVSLGQKAYDPNDLTKTTMRQTIENAQYGGNINTNGISLGQKTYDPKDLTRTTMRQATELDQFGGNINTNNVGLGQKTYDPKDLTRTTMRQTTELDQFGGNINTNNVGLGQKTYDPKDLTRTTMRQTTEFDQFGGNINTNNVGLGQKTYDPKDLTRTTMRQTIENAQYGGNINTNGVNLGQKTYDPNALTKTTSRQTIEQSQHTGNLNTGSVGLGQKTYDPNALTKTTSRQTIENATYTGNINTSGVGLGQKTYDPNDLTKTTSRQIIENATYTGQMANTKLGNKVFNPFDVTLTTGRQLIENSKSTGYVNGSSIYNGKSYDPTQLTNTTGRQLIEDNDWNGGAYTAMNGPAYDPTQLTNPTGRQLIEDNDWTGGAYTAMNGPAYDPTQLTNPTGRQMIEDSEYAGVAYNNIGQVTYDPDDKARDTNRQSTEVNEYHGTINAQIGTGDGYLTAPKDIADTARQSYSKNTYTAPAEYANAPKVYESAYHMRQNDKLEETVNNRAPSQVRSALSAGVSSVNLKTCDKNDYSGLETIRSAMPLGILKPQSHLGQITTNKRHIPERNVHWDTTPEIVPNALQIPANDIHIPR